MAEYTALIEGLEVARTLRIDRIRVFVDSELLVDQLDGKAEVKKEHVKPLYDRAKTLVDSFPNIRVSWVPRRLNSEADALATKALNSAS